MRAHGRLVGSLLTALAATFFALPEACAQDPATVSPGAAAEPWRGFYVGGGGSYSTVSVEVYGGGCYDDCYYWWGDYPDYDEGDGDYGYSVHFGWRAHTYLAIEAA